MTTTEEIPTRDIAAVLETLKRLSGISIPISKKLMVMHRLRHRLAELEVTDVGQYVRGLEGDRQERQRFINVLTTNETSFFRTEQLWVYFREVYLPAQHSGGRQRPFCAWSAASSTGEEAYSIAMACLDFQEKHPGFSFRVLATDIDTDVLAKAEAGVYIGRNLKRFQESRGDFSARYLDVAGEEFRVQDRVRRQVTFRKHNLMGPCPTGGPFDAIFLRNVMIYFDAPERRRVLATLPNALTEGGHLILGESEALLDMHDTFEFVRPMVYQRTPTR
jgi:chemotaxis protein methyltransferase CheR